jgi:hypothetical protein
MKCGSPSPPFQGTSEVVTGGGENLIERVDNTIHYLVHLFTDLKVELDRCSEWKRKLEEESVALQLEKERWQKEKANTEDMNLKLDSKVVLNVGGKRMETTTTTLRSAKSSLITILFSGNHKLQQDKDGGYFLDRDPQIFRYVLNYLRDHKLRLPDVKENEVLRQAILDEFDYFCIPVQDDQLQQPNSILDYQQVVHVKTIRHHYVTPWMIKVHGKRVVTCGQPVEDEYGLNILNIDTGQREVSFLKNRNVYSVNILGNVLLAGGFKNIWVIDLITKQQMKIKGAHESAVRCVNVYNGYIISCSLDKSIKIWDLHTGIFIRQLDGHTEGIYCMDISDPIMMTGSRDNTIKVWNLNNWQCTDTFLGHNDVVRGVRILKDCIVSCSDDSTVKVWSPTGECRNTLMGHTDSVYYLDIQNNIITTSSSDNTVRIWNLLTGTCCFTLRGHTDWVDAVVQVGQYFVSLSQDKTIRVWQGTN